MELYVVLSFKKGILPTSPLYRQFDHLILKDGILFREVKNDGDETTKQLVLPTTYVKTVLQSLHWSSMWFFLSFQATVAMLNPVFNV
jgi:hypothetical protein